MFPYFEQPEWQVGGYRIGSFAILLVVAIMVGRWLMIRRAKKVGLDSAAALSFCRWATLAGGVGAILVVPISGNPTSVAALIGGMLAGAISLATSGVGFGQSLAYMDAAAFAFPWAWMIFRTGCALAHDHVGIESHSFLAVAFPRGPHLDLGLLEALFMIPVALALSVIGRRPRPSGALLALLLLLYGPFRLLLHSLRPLETRGTSVSTDQWGGWIAITTAVAILIWIYQRSKLERKNA